MVSFSAFKTFLFLLIAASSGADQTFVTKMHGKWRVVDLDYLGRNASTKEKPVLPSFEFSFPGKEPKIGKGVAKFEGELKVQKGLGAAKVDSITALYPSPSGDAKLTVLIRDARVLIELKGDTMRLLLTVPSSKYDVIPTSITVKDNPHSSLWTLLRVGKK